MLTEAPWLARPTLPTGSVYNHSDTRCLVEPVYLRSSVCTPLPGARSDLLLPMGSPVSSKQLRVSSLSKFPKSAYTNSDPISRQVSYQKVSVGLKVGLRDVVQKMQ